MAFADKREFAYWLDQSGNNNDWTSNNLTESDISVDSPTNNFATLESFRIKVVLHYQEGNLEINSYIKLSADMGYYSFYYSNTF